MNAEFDRRTRPTPKQVSISLEGRVPSNDSEYKPKKTEISSRAIDNPQLRQLQDRETDGKILGKVIARRGGKIINVGKKAVTASNESSSCSANSHS